MYNYNQIYNVYDDLDYRAIAYFFERNSRFFAQLIVVIAVFMGVWVVLNYFLKAVALTKLAHVRGVRGGWLAWVPVFGPLYVQGHIADRVESGNSKRTAYAKWAVLLLISRILCVAAMWGSFIYNINAMKPLAALGTLYILVFLWFCLYAAAYVVDITCGYEIFRNCKPERALVYTLIFILFMPAREVLYLHVAKRDGAAETTDVGYTL